MEHLFSPCARLYDILKNRGQHPEYFQDLNLDVSSEELLRAERAFTYADLYALLEKGETVAWLTPHAAVARKGGRAMRYWRQLNESYRLFFCADGEEIIALAHSHELLLEICDVVLRLLAVSIVHSVLLNSWSYCDDALINTPTLLYLMEQCQSLQTLTLKELDLDEDHCRVLGACTRPSLEISLHRCTITEAGASALPEVLKRNQGPTELSWCSIDNVILADGLRGNSRLKVFTPLISSDLEVGSRELFAIAGALRENKGLVELNLFCSRFRMSEETWGAVCDSLQAHSTLEVLYFHGASCTVATATPALLKSRVQKVVDMMKGNMSIHTKHLPHRLGHHELFRRSVIPDLETNRFRPRLLAIQKICPIPYRGKVLGRALLTVRADPNRFWMLLSGNA
jgi:hypothetical protein